MSAKENLVGQDGERGSRTICGLRGGRAVFCLGYPKHRRMILLLLIGIVAVFEIAQRNQFPN